MPLAVPGTVVDSADITVVLRVVDMEPLEKELEKVNLRTNGSRFNYLLFGSYPHEELVIPDDTHHFMRHANHVRVDLKTAEFLERKLLRSGAERPSR